MNTRTEPATLSVEEAARVLGVGRRAAYRAIAAGTLPYLKVGRLVRVPRPALERLLAEPPVPRPRTVADEA
jgi:excisionase family DNA binding protein